MAPRRTCERTHPYSLFDDENVFRYCAFFWTVADDAAGTTVRRWIAQCTNWQVVVDEPGMAILCIGITESQPARILQDCSGRIHGVVLGDLFTASPNARCYRFTPDESERILRNAGRQLISDYWGNYVALWRDPQTHRRWALRGPAATLPCLHTSLADVEIYFSWTEAVAALEPAAFSINWKFMARSLTAPLASSYTGINEIHEIPAGFCKSATLQRYWDPFAIARTDPIDSFDVATNELHTAAQACAHAWAQSVPRIVHALSGGLDSSIVLACLNDAPSRPEIVCLTHFTAGPDSDERAYARLAARHANRELIEREHPQNIDLHGALHGVRFETSPGLRMPEIDRIELDLAHERGAEIITRGDGGDELFCRHHTHFYVADFLRAHAFHPALLPLLLHAAFREGETIWVVLARAIRNAFIPRRWDMMAIFRDDQEDQSLLHPDVLADMANDREFGLPEVQSTRDCAPGKLWQINLLAGRRFHYLPSMRDGDARPVSPLLSQPLIETCLRIPTYMQMANRRERAVARAAFVCRVPEEILERRWKGGAEEHAWQILRQNLAFVREVLLEGQLVAAGFVDRPRLETLLTGDPSTVVRATVPVFELLGAEAWLRAWGSEHRTYRDAVGAHARIGQHAGEAP